jgi:hypothetical protein
LIFHKGEPAKRENEDRCRPRSIELNIHEKYHYR